ncbi:Nudix family hydrolase [Neisseriaceae bacterium TC5R-5]|nr:Nudix family hydrolase [Neisseriaceae bacterium TC5R-5]
MNTKTIAVVAGVLMQADGRFMLGSRPEGKPYAGYWEFPGGKVEPGETPWQALVREFEEEMGIVVTRATPWLSKVHHYEHASVHLRFFKVWEWQGEPQPREGQAFAWQQPGRYTVGPMLPANEPILKSLQLPPYYAISCAHELGVAQQLQCLRQGPAWGILQIREPQMSIAELADFVAQVADIVAPHQTSLLVNADPAQVVGWPIAGVHLSAQRLAALSSRPDFAWVGASIHSAAELQQAAALQLDYALLGHVAATASHPQATPLAWEGFANCLAAGTPLPVYALGGLAKDSLELARAHGAHGVALMRRAWQ